MIIGFHGKIGSGKDTAADFVMSAYEDDRVERLSFAAPLKEVVRRGFGLTQDHVMDAWMKEQPILVEMTVTPNLLMQQWRELLLDVLGKDVFAHVAEKRLGASNKEIVVITDVGSQTKEIVEIEKGVRYGLMYPPNDDHIKREFKGCKDDVVFSCNTNHIELVYAGGPIPEELVEYISLDEPLREIVRKGFGLTKEQMTKPDEPVFVEMTVTPRQLLQKWGTDILRPELGDDIFLRVMETKIKESFTAILVITDVRFPNEAKLINCSGGRVVHIVRPGHAGSVHTSHASETPLPEELVDHVIVNDKGLEEFATRVMEVVEGILRE
jgi:hypothetical protein